MLLTLTIATTFVIVLQVFVQSTKRGAANHLVSSYSHHDQPLEFPHGCLNCRTPATLPWVYRDLPESFHCDACRIEFEVSFVAGAVGIPPSYHWCEQDPSGNGSMEALVSDCPHCRGRLSFYVERRANSARRPIARCRKCGSSESLELS